MDPSWSSPCPANLNEVSNVSSAILCVVSHSDELSQRQNPFNCSTGGRDRARLEEQKKSGRNVSRHVELANKEPARIFRKTMTSKKSERKAQRSCMTAHFRCRSINVLTFTFLVSRGKIGKCRDVDSKG